MALTLHTVQLSSRKGFLRVAGLAFWRANLRVLNVERNSGRLRGLAGNVAADSGLCPHLVLATRKLTMSLEMILEQVAGEIKEETAQLYSSFTQFAEQSRKRLVEDKVHFSSRIETIKNQIEHLKNQKVILANTKAGLEKTLQDEEGEEEEIKKDIQALKEQLGELLQKEGVAAQEYQRVKENCDRENKLLEEEGDSWVEEQRSCRKDLKFYRDYLGLEIVSQGENQARLVFTLINKEDLAKEFVLTLDLGEPVRVVECEPPLLGIHKTVDGFVAARGTSLATLLKTVRAGFVALEKERRNQGGL